MQDPNEDTEWNDVLRAKGILPPKPEEPSEDDADTQVSWLGRPQADPRERHTPSHHP